MASNSSELSGIILKGLGGLYTVYYGGDTFACTPRGILRREQKKPLVGDKVVLSEINFDKKTAVIDDILPRENEMIRPFVANIGRLFIVISAFEPEPDLILLDKMLIMARESNVEPAIIINKADKDRAKAEAMREEYKNACEVYIVSAREGKGVDDVIRAMDGRISVLAGQSGVGKSTFTNLATQSEVMQTGELSDRLGRGRNTTRHTEILRIESPLLTRPSFIIDSPGFNTIELQTDTKNLITMYPEAYNCGVCRFLDCSHTKEPGCQIKALVESGQFNPERYLRYTEIYATQKLKEKNRYR